MEESTMIIPMNNEMTYQLDYSRGGNQVIASLTDTDGDVLRRDAFSAADVFQMIQWAISERERGNIYLELDFTDESQENQTETEKES